VPSPAPSSAAEDEEEDSKVLLKLPSTTKSCGTSTTRQAESSVSGWQRGSAHLPPPSGSGDGLPPPERPRPSQPGEALHAPGPPAPPSCPIQQLSPPHLAPLGQNW